MVAVIVNTVLLKIENIKTIIVAVFTVTYCISVLLY